MNYFVRGFPFWGFLFWDPRPSRLAGSFLSQRSTCCVSLDLGHEQGYGCVFFSRPPKWLVTFWLPFKTNQKTGVFVKLRRPYGRPLQNNRASPTAPRLRRKQRGEAPRPSRVLLRAQHGVVPALHSLEPGMRRRFTRSSRNAV